MPRAKAKTTTSRKSKSRKAATRATRKSFYKQYPLEFFDGDTHCAWKVKPSGNYVEDCETGARYAREFLATCDGTVGWTGVLSNIVMDMIGRGAEGRWPDGAVRADGLVVGFMGQIGRALNLAMRMPGMDFLLAYAQLDDAKLSVSVAESQTYKDAEEESETWKRAFEAQRTAERALAAAPATSMGMARIRSDIVAEMVKDCMEQGRLTVDTLTPMALALKSDLERLTAPRVLPA